MSTENRTADKLIGSGIDDLQHWVTGDVFRGVGSCGRSADNRTTFLRSITKQACFLQKVQRMKKALLLLMLYVAAVSFSSCEKDDVHPKQDGVEKDCCDDNGDLPSNPGKG